MTFSYTTNMRLDQLLSYCQLGSRQQIKRLLKSQQVTVDGMVIRKASQNVDPELQRIEVNGKQIKESCVKNRG